MENSYPKINDSSIIALPVKECAEKVQSLLDLPRIVLPTQVSLPLPFGDKKNLFVRKGVRDRLQVALNLLPDNVGILLLAAYRPYSVQKRLFDKWIQKIMSEYPDLKLEKAKERVTEFVSDPDVFSPHLTGAALDVALVDQNNSLLDMGNLFQYNDTAKTTCVGLTQEQQDNRALLIDVMTKAGFVNYPYEWWHWSYGDKYWAYCTGNMAVYDSLILPEHENKSRMYRNISRAARWLINTFHSNTRERS